tara:strand:- start:29 stop:502 length:474 start_codon:yes stop_codon:yes gene_type:complete
MSRLYNAFKNIFKGGTPKTTGTEVISSVNIAKNLAKKKNIKDDLVKARDKQLAGVRDEAKVEIKSNNPLSKFTKKIEKIVDRKAKGGRVGLKRGTGLGGKSNIAKIKKTFSSQSPMSRMTGKKKKKGFPDMSGDGKITQKDILIAKGVIPKPKKKVI